LQAPYESNQIVDNVIEAFNQMVTMTTANERLTVNMIGLLDNSIKWCLKNNRRSLLLVRDNIELSKRFVEARDGVVQRLNLLLNDERLFEILCGNNTIEWGQFIDERQTLIVDTSGMSRPKMIFLGALISSGIKNYFRYQHRDEYQPLSLLVDECHLYLNADFFDILKEGRKYRLSCVLSTQDFSSISERMMRTMLNTGTLISYRVGHKEAQHLAQEMGCSPDTLQTLEKYHVSYLTPSQRGIAKTPMPPLVKKIVLPKKGQHPIEKFKHKWVPLQSYHPANDFDHLGDKVLVDAQRQGAETLLSEVTDSRIAKETTRDEKG
jgi:hypothetical protein